LDSKSLLCAFLVFTLPFFIYEVLLGRWHTSLQFQKTLFLKNNLFSHKEPSCCLRERPAWRSPPLLVYSFVRPPPPRCSCFIPSTSVCPSNCVVLPPSSDGKRVVLSRYDPPTTTHGFASASSFSAVSPRSHLVGPCVSFVIFPRSKSTTVM